MARAAGMTTIVGGAGIIIGSFGLKFVRNPDNILHFVKLGVVFLLTQSTLFNPSANEILNY
jgi:Kef-type K+ transport system membrane component KefB